MEHNYSNYLANQQIDNLYPKAPLTQTHFPGEQDSSDLVAHIHPELTQSEVEILKVSAKSRPSSVAGAIAGVIRHMGKVEVQAIGAGAINQAIKAVAISRGYLISSGIDIFFLPAFIDISIEGEERTAIKLVIEKRDNLQQPH